MTIAIDKNGLSALDNKNEFVYLFDKECLNDLLDLNLHCLRYDYCNRVDINLTNYDVECFKKASINDVDCKVLPPKKNFKFAIIIPNYNYEQTIEKCLTSILDQTYKNFEIIFVDDMSTDNSVEVAKRLLKPPHKVIELKQKRLNGGSRNEGYLYVSDDTDYIYYVDSDDWLFDNNCLEKINDHLQKQPDVLFVGLASFKNGKTKRDRIPQYKDRYEAIQGWSGSCGKVIKKSLATKQECLYAEGTLKEDRNQHCRICIHMKDFECLKEPIYVWNQDNYNSVTTVRDNIVWGTSTIRHYADTKQLYLTYKGKDPKIDEYLKQRLQRCKDEIFNGGDRQW